MSETPNPVALWIHKAEEDLRMAELALGQDHPLTDHTAAQCRFCHGRQIGYNLCFQNMASWRETSEKFSHTTSILV